MLHNGTDKLHFGKRDDFVKYELVRKPDWELEVMNIVMDSMATHSSTLAWRIPGRVQPGGLPSMGSHRVEHDWSDLAAAALVDQSSDFLKMILTHSLWWLGISPLFVVLHEFHSEIYIIYVSFKVL